MEEEQQKRDAVKDIQFEHGYRLGFVDSNKVGHFVLHPLDFSSLRVLCTLLLTCSNVSLLPCSIICTTTCPSSSTSTKRSWKRLTSTTTGWCDSRWYLKVSRWTVGPDAVHRNLWARTSAVEVSGRKTLTCFGPPLLLHRSEGCRKWEDLHAARSQRLGPPGNRPGHGERGPFHLLCALEGQSRAAQCPGDLNQPTRSSRRITWILRMSQLGIDFGNNKKMFVGLSCSTYFKWMWKWLS